MLSCMWLKRRIAPPSMLQEFSVQSHQFTNEEIAQVEPNERAGSSTHTCKGRSGYAKVARTRGRNCASPSIYGMIIYNAKPFYKGKTHALSDHKYFGCKIVLLVNVDLAMSTIMLSYTSTAPPLCLHLLSTWLYCLTQKVWLKAKVPIAQLMISLEKVDLWIRITFRRSP